MRPHLDGRPVREIAVVHLETVMVFEDGDNIASAGFFKEMCPGLGIILLGFEHGDEVLITEPGQRPISAYMMLIHFRPLEIHLAGIPLAAKCGDRIDAPVNEDAELRIPVPIGHFVLGERIPVGTEWPVVGSAVYVGQDCAARSIVFCGRLLPHVGQRLGALRCCRSGVRLRHGAERR